MRRFLLFAFRICEFTHTLQSLYISCDSHCSALHVTCRYSIKLSYVVHQFLYCIFYLLKHLQSRQLSNNHTKVLRLFMEIIHQAPPPPPPPPLQAEAPYVIIDLTHYKIQSTLVISTSVISNNRLSRRKNLVLV